MDVVLGGVCEEVDAALELLQELRVPPWGDGLDCGVKSYSAHLEADLIVALAGGSVGYVLGTFSLGDSDLSFGDQRAGDGGAEQVSALVDGVALHGGEDEVWCKKQKVSANRGSFGML